MPKTAEGLPPRRSDPDGELPASTPGLGILLPQRCGSPAPFVIPAEAGIQVQLTLLLQWIYSSGKTTPRYFAIVTACYPLLDPGLRGGGRAGTWGITRARKNDKVELE